ncbi:MAG: PilZ domain-containing protein [Deltaproteobacteria bacterium]|nr:PilZ domain-containing protein [Deltaproteobacteria bacterium]
MALSPTEDRPARQEQRHGRRRAALLRCWLSDGAVERYTSLADVSLEGARVATVAPPPVGAVVTLRFRPRPQGGVVEAVARVVWRTEGFRGRGGVVGLHFVEVTGMQDLAALVAEG